MLIEIVTKRTHSQGYRRRWFQSEKMDLYTWHTDLGEIVGFQLAYDRLSDQRAITWVRSKGFFHARVDEGWPDFVSQTAILVPDDRFDAYRVHSEFVAQAEQLDKDIALLVSRRLREYFASTRRGISHGPVPLWVGILAGCLIGLLLRRLLR